MTIRSGQVTPSIAISKNARVSAPQHQLGQLTTALNGQQIVQAVNASGQHKRYLVMNCPAAGTAAPAAAVQGRALQSGKNKPIISLGLISETRISL